MMQDAKKEHFFAILRGFSHAMLTTHSREGGLHTRPMVVADVDSNGDIWLLSSSTSEKVEELAEDHHVNVSMQGADRYVAVAGDAELVHDKRRIQALFKEAWKVYFPRGAQDPHIVLIKVNSVHGEYWDNAGVSKVKYLWEVAKAYVTGTSPTLGDDIRGKVQLNA